LLDLNAPLGQTGSMAEVQRFRRREASPTYIDLGLAEGLRPTEEGRG
jgi:hypothetical protein